jgi:GMP synthase (glutamine-hydrolysing)
MNIHAFYHASFEGLGSIKQWISQSGYSLTETHWYKTNPMIPEIRNIDVLIVMGGPMGIYDESAFPWLAQEKKFIREAISLHKKVLGICLGAQLIADALGAKVYSNQYKEIGWFPIQGSNVEHDLTSFFPKSQIVFHWHGDTFDLPDDADLLASSEACRNQAFCWNDSVLGLQYHLEVELNDVEIMVKNGNYELVDAPFIQKSQEILGETRYFESNKALLFRLLDAFFR